MKELTMQRTVPVIIGHTGRMGTMLMARWQEAGLSPLGADRELQADGSLGFSPAALSEAIGKSTVVVLCVPVSTIQDVLRLVVPHMTNNQILMDITSVKELPMQWMEQAYAGPIVGTHPLFGPNPVPEDMRVVLTPGTRACANHTQCVATLFESMGCTVFITTPAKHDQGVGFAQSLNFTVCASFFATLARQDNIRPFLTPSFKRLMEAARKHLTQDTAMFCEFSKANPHFPAILQEYRRTLDDAERLGLEAIAAEAVVWYKDENG